MGSRKAEAMLMRKIYTSEDYLDCVCHMAGCIGFFKIQRKD